MAHKAEYYWRVENENQELIFYLDAKWKDKNLDVFKYNFTTNKIYYRWGNIDFYQLGGWLVQYPNERARYNYYGREIIPLYPYLESKEWYEGLKYGNLHEWIGADRLKRLILECHPEYKYFLKKYNFESVFHKIPKLIDLMNMWKEHPSEVEALVSLGFFNVALNKNLYRLTKPKKQEIIRALKEFVGSDGNPSLITVQEYIKSGMKFEEWYAYKCWNSWRNGDSIETFRYCQRKGIDKTRYHDMLDMARNQGHDIEDEYWKYPNDPNAMHDRLLEIKLRLDKIEADKKHKKEQRYWNKLKEIQMKNLKEPLVLDGGYKIFMPTTYEEYKKTAEELHQCILAGEYYKKVAKGQSLLLMIWIDDKPRSTCEITYDGKIRQFYGNELNRNNCKPSEQEQVIMNQFLAKFKPKKLKGYCRT